MSAVFSLAFYFSLDSYERTALEFSFGPCQFQ